MTILDTKAGGRAAARWAAAQSAAAQSAAVYARISQDPGNTLEDVRRQVRKAIKRVDSRGGDWQMSDLPGSPLDPRHPGGEHWPPGVFVDHDTCAGTEYCRQEYRRMHAAMERGEVTVVLAKALDRLWHTLAETAEALVKMRAARVHLELFDTAPSLALDGRLVQVFPATWAGGLTDPAAAPAAPMAAPIVTDRADDR